MARCSSKSDELRKINSIACRARNITKNNNFKIKIVTFIINIGRTYIIRNGQMQVQKCGFGLIGICFIKLEF